MTDCPLAAVDRRLDDLHQQWHEAEAVYFDPESFRRAIQTAVQAARTVTFILQSNKAIFPDFSGWYEPWQEKFKADPLMRWMVDARNRIEKQGDLEAHSFVRAEIIGSHLSNERPVMEARAELFDAPWQIVRAIPSNDLGTHLKANGTLRIERRWVENSLPDWELLDAVATAFGRLRELVDDAHRALGMPVEKGTAMADASGRAVGEGRPPCMIGHADRRAQMFSLSDGRRLELEATAVEIDVARGPEMEARYGMSPAQMYPPAARTSAEAFADATFEAARTVFLTDGYHSHIDFLMKDGKPIGMVGSRIDELGQKYLLSKQLGDEVRKSGADAVLTIDEVWTAPYDASRPFQGAVGSPERGEALVASLAQKDAEIVRWIAEIVRDGESVRLGETRRESGGAAFHLASVYEAWGREIPAEWLEARS